MLGMGIGMGMMMQNLVLAVQNTVDVSEVGAASATVTFFRSLGGAVGVSVLGAVLVTRVTNLITEHLRALGLGGAAAQGGSGSVLDVNALPGPVQEIVRHAYGDATGRIFVIAAGAALVSLLAVLFIREVPLRRTVAMGASADGSLDGAGAGASGAGGAGVGGGAGVAGVASYRETVADDPAERAALVALDVITSAERTAREREREASERVQAAATTIRQMRTDVADLFTRVDQQIADLENTLPDADIPQPAAAILDAQRPAGELVDELRRYELSVLSASQRTADHLRETARTDADSVRTTAHAEADHLRTTAQAEADHLRATANAEVDHLRTSARTEADHLLTEARAEEQEIRARVLELQAVERRLLITVRDNLSESPRPPASPTSTHAGGPAAVAHPGSPAANITHEGSRSAPAPGNGYPEDAPHRQPFG
jgi:hypothetical protein